MNKLKSFFKRRFLKFKFSFEYLRFKKPNNLEDFIYLENTKVYEAMFYYFHKFLSKDLKSSLLTLNFYLVLKAQKRRKK